MTTITELPKLPLPNDPFLEATVIASVWGNDDLDLVVDGKPIPAWALVMLLRPFPPYYLVCEIAVTPNGWYAYQTAEHPNIVPATRDYENKGGDY